MRVAGLLAVPATLFGIVIWFADRLASRTTNGRLAGWLAGWSIVLPAGQPAIQPGWPAGQLLHQSDDSMAGRAVRPTG